jgi:hypothetical protein
MDFNVPNLPGSSDIYNKIAAKVADIEKDIKASLDIPASELKTKLESHLTDLVEKTKGLIPELPTTTPVNFQAEIEGLLALSPTSSGYAEKLAGLSNNFGPGLIEAGYALDDLVVAGASALKGASGSLSGALPNFEIPAGSLESIQVAKASMMPEVLALKEAAHKFSTDVSEDDVKAIFGDAFSTKKLEETKSAMETFAKKIEKDWGAKAARLQAQLDESFVQDRESANIKRRTA